MCERQLSKPPQYSDKLITVELKVPSENVPRGRHWEDFANHSAPFPLINKSPSCRPKTVSSESEIRLPVLTKSGATSNVGGILDFPERVRVKILRYLSYQDRLNAQLVCRTFRNEMRMRVGLHSRLSEASSKRGLLFMRDVFVETITVGRYIEPTLTPAQIIGRPDTVENLIFEEPISIAHLDAILSRCHRVETIVVAAPPLESLTVPISNGPINNNGSLPRTPVTDSLRNWETIVKEPVQLECLRELSLILPGRKAIFYFQKLLTVVSGENLLKLSLRIGTESDRVDSRQIHTRILHLLKKLRKLTHLFISTMPGPFNSPIPDSAYFIGCPKSEIVELSRGIQLKTIVLTESSPIYQIWNIFLSSQKQLQIFQVLHLMSLRTLTSIISSNVCTLRKVAIRVQLWQKGGPQLPLSMEVFENCQVLEELMIDLSGDTSGIEEMPNVVLLRKLPSSLRILALQECNFLTFDLLQMRKCHGRLESMGFVCKKELVSGYGVTYRALLHLLRYPKLNELLVSGIRVNERDKFALRKVKKVFESGLKMNRTGLFYIPHQESERCRWIIGQNGTCLFRFVSTWGIAE